MSNPFWTSPLAGFATLTTAEAKSELLNEAGAEMVELAQALRDAVPALATGTPAGTAQAEAAEMIAHIRLRLLAGDADTAGVPLAVLPGVVAGLSPGGPTAESLSRDAAETETLANWLLAARSR